MTITTTDQTRRNLLKQHQGEGERSSNSKPTVDEVFAHESEDQMAWDHPMKQAIQVGGKTVDRGLLFRALAEGDSAVIQRLEEQIRDVPQRDESEGTGANLHQLADAIESGLGEMDSETRGEDKRVNELKNLQGTVTDVAVAAEFIEQELMVDALGFVLETDGVEEEYEGEIVDDLIAQDEVDLSDSDAETLNDADIHTVEVVEDVVDRWTAARLTTYSVSERKKMEEEEVG